MLMLKNNYVFILFDCIFILFNFCSTLISWLSSRLIGSIVTEMSDTEKCRVKNDQTVCDSVFVEMGT